MTFLISPDSEPLWKVEFFVGFCTIVFFWFLLILDTALEEIKSGRFTFWSINLTLHFWLCGETPGGCVFPLNILRPSQMYQKLCKLSYV